MQQPSHAVVLLLNLISLKIAHFSYHLCHLLGKHAIFSSICFLIGFWTYYFLSCCNGQTHELRTPREEIAFTAWPKIQSKSQIFKYSRSIFCVPHRPNFSDIFNLYLHWVSVVCGQIYVESFFSKIHIPHNSLIYIWNIFQVFFFINLLKYFCLKVTGNCPDYLSLFKVILKNWKLKQS